MEDLAIYIPTYRRPTRQRTLQLLHGVLAAQTFLVVQPQEEIDYLEHNPEANILVLPERKDGWNLPKTRQWIHENAEARYVIQMDDDLDFHYRPYQRVKNPPDGEPHTRLKPSGALQIEMMLQGIYDALSSDYGHVGVSAREGNVHTKEPFALNTRMMRFLAHDNWLLRDIGLRWDVVEDYEDFNMTLGLLLRDEPNLVFFEYSQGQPGSNTEGGCSVYRNDEFHTRAARHLEARFPGFVKVVRKDANNWRGMDERTDVRVSWKKAAEHGASHEWTEGPSWQEFKWEPEAAAEAQGDRSAAETAGSTAQILDLRDILEDFRDGIGMRRVAKSILGRVTLAAANLLDGRGMRQVLEAALEDSSEQMQEAIDVLAGEARSAGLQVLESEEEAAAAAT